MFERPLPIALRQRESSLAAWRAYDVDAVPEALRLLADAFVWTDEDVRRLRPEDRLWPIYWTYYPQKHWWQRLKPDQLEMEMLLKALQKRDPLADLPPDVTIADVVRMLSPKELRSDVPDHHGRQRPPG